MTLTPGFPRRTMFVMKINPAIYEWTATGLSLVGAAINIQHSRWGFFLWILAAVFWITWGCVRNPGKVAWGLVVSQICFVALNIYGFIQWSKPS